MNECPICGSLKNKTNITCSKKCAAKKSRKVDWDSVNLQNMLAKFKSFSKVGEQLGVSDVAVKKRAIKLNIIDKFK